MSAENLPLISFLILELDLFLKITIGGRDKFYPFYNLRTQRTENQRIAYKPFLERGSILNRFDMPVFFANYVASLFTNKENFCAVAVGILTSHNNIFLPPQSPEIASSSRRDDVCLFVCFLYGYLSLL